MNTAFDRESIRARLRMWRDVDRRLALERAVEHLPDDALALLLDGMLRLDEHRSSARRPSLLERVREHAAATRRGDHRGNYVIRNAHGQRQPWQTDAWIAATHNLFDLELADVRARRRHVRTGRRDRGGGRAASGANSGAGAPLATGGHRECRLPTSPPSDFRGHFRGDFLGDCRGARKHDSTSVARETAPGRAWSPGLGQAGL